jgi:hypothetical protein
MSPGSEILVESIHIVNMCHCVRPYGTDIVSQI